MQNATMIFFIFKTKKGPSPDEIALVDAAKHIGFQYCGTNLNKIHVAIKN